MTNRSRGLRVRRPSPWHYLGEAVIFLLLIVVALAEILPVMWLFSTSLRDPAQSMALPPSFFPTSWRWENYRAVLASKQINFVLFFFNSLKVAVIITVLRLVLNSFAAFSFGRLRFPGRDTLFFLFLASMMVPGNVTVVPRFILLRVVGLMDTLWALILPGMAGAFGVFLLRQFFMTLPTELIDAAKIDGAGYFRIYWQVMLPQIGPGLSALGIFSFLNSWNSFQEPLLFLRSWTNFTLPLGIVTLQGFMGEGNRAHVLAAVMLSIFPILVVFLLAQRFVVQGIATTGLKG